MTTTTDQHGGSASADRDARGADFLDGSPYASIRANRAETIAEKCDRVHRAIDTMSRPAPGCSAGYHLYDIATDLAAIIRTDNSADAYGLVCRMASQAWDAANAREHYIRRTGEASAREAQRSAAATSARLAVLMAESLAADAALRDAYDDETRSDGEVTDAEADASEARSAADERTAEVAEMVREAVREVLRPIADAETIAGGTRNEAIADVLALVDLRDIEQEMIRRVRHS